MANRAIIPKYCSPLYKNDKFRENPNFVLLLSITVTKQLNIYDIIYDSFCCYMAAKLRSVACSDLRQIFWVLVYANLALSDCNAISTCLRNSHRDPLHLVCFFKAHFSLDWIRFSSSAEPVTVYCHLIYQSFICILTLVRISMPVSFNFQSNNRPTLYHAHVIISKSYMLHFGYPHHLWTCCALCSRENPSVSLLNSFTRVFVFPLFHATITSYLSGFQDQACVNSFFHLNDSNIYP